VPIVQVIVVVPVQVKVGPAVCVIETNVVCAGSTSVSVTLDASDGPLFATAIVYVTFAPAVAVAGAVFVTATSALAPAVVEAVEVLFAGAGSGVALVTFAVLATVPVAAGESVATSSNVAEVAGVSVAIVQVMVAPVVQVNVGPAVCVNDTNVVCAGSTSVSVTVIASDGPLFATTIVYVTFDPAVAVGGAVFVTDTSAFAPRTVEAVEVLFAGSGSAVVLVTFAVFTIVPLAAGEMVVTSSNVAEVAGVSVEIVQVMVAPVVQLNVGPDVCVNETNVVCAGSVSVSVTVAASDGPLFATTIV
jgi:hypothetical protein